MKVQVLCATMHQKDFSKLDQMNVHSDIIFANQDDNSRYEEIKFENYTAKMITTNTKGVGINRNVALMYADEDICLIADDDMKYCDDYVEVVQKAFKEYPKADVLIFNIDVIGGYMKTRLNNKSKRIRLYNGMNYGAVRIAVKTSSIKAKNIFFTTCFGGGTKYSSGEDSLLIWDMLKKGLKIYTYPYTIATVDQRVSSWFSGYKEKYFYDKGAFFYAMTGKLADLFCIRDLLLYRHRYKNENSTFLKAFKTMKQGMKGFKNNLTTYEEYKNKTE